jgi:hypothetical protein
LRDCLPFLESVGKADFLPARAQKLHQEKNLGMASSKKIADEEQRLSVILDRPSDRSARTGALQAGNRHGQSLLLSL